VRGTGGAGERTLQQPGRQGHVEVTVTVEVAHGGVRGVDPVTLGTGRHDLAAGQPALPAPDDGQRARVLRGTDVLAARADDQVRVAVAVQVAEGEAGAEEVLGLGGAGYARRVLADDLPVRGVQPLRGAVHDAHVPGAGVPADLAPGGGDGEVRVAVAVEVGAHALGAGRLRTGRVRAHGSDDGPGDGQGGHESEAGTKPALAHMEPNSR
jgi:hypothetical protein